MPDKSQLPYLDYLDKEMSIMGILSTFCVLLVGGVLGGIGTSEKASLLGEIWDRGWMFVLAGSVYGMVAALYFYGQRSLLAWYFGQICLCLQSPTLAEHDRSLNEWLSEADSHSAWFRYSNAFAFLSAGIFEFGLAILRHRVNIPWAKTLVLAPAIVVIGFLLARQTVLKKYNKQDDAWQKFWSSLSKS